MPPDFQRNEWLRQNQASICRKSHVAKFPHQERFIKWLIVGHSGGHLTKTMAMNLPELEPSIKGDFVFYFWTPLSERQKSQDVVARIYSRN